MFCTSCGTKNLADSNFCKQCGHKLEKNLSAKISEDDYDRALPDEEQVIALLERAYRLRAEGDAARAITLCEEALRLRPNSAAVHSLLAQLYEGIGERERAIRELDRVLELNPASIADRIKRDELRDGIASAPRHIVSSRLVLAESGSNASRLAVAGVLIVLLSLGWGYTLATRPRALEPTTARVASPVKTASVPEVSPPATTDRAPTSPPTNTANTAATTPTSEASSVPSSFGFLSPPIYYPVPTPVPGRAGIRPPVWAPANVTHAAAPTERHSSAPPAQTASATNPNSIYLDNSDPNDDTVVINVAGSDKDKKGAKPAPSGETTHPSAPATTKGDGEKPSGPPVLKITPSKDNSSAASTSDSGADRSAQTRIAVASDYMKKGDYDRAIATYRKALPSAGDDTGYVYQQIAVCFQRKDDHNSAIANYQQALTEFQRLKTAGRLKDRDSDGIRVCQRGITICSSK